MAASLYSKIRVNLKALTQIKIREVEEDGDKYYEVYGITNKGEAVTIEEVGSWDSSNPEQDAEEQADYYSGLMNGFTPIVYVRRGGDEYLTTPFFVERDEWAQASHYLKVMEGADAHKFSLVPLYGHTPPEYPY